MLSTNNMSGPGEGSSLKSMMISSGQAVPIVIHQQM